SSLGVFILIPLLLLFTTCRLLCGSPTFGLTACLFIRFSRIASWAFSLDCIVFGFGLGYTGFFKSFRRILPGSNSFQPDALFLGGTFHPGHPFWRQKSVVPRH